MSVLLFKNNSVRNNVKSSMISRLISDLETTDTTEGGMIPTQKIEIDLGAIDKNQNFCSEANELPCINCECEFLKYQKIFYPKMDFFMLPAMNERYFCIVCDMMQNEKLRRSQIQILNNRSIRLQN